mmetsp:Transcript_26967/g.72349  ORF Transcript_26967/g.72349 Transcript_26967/m.72349 type:complete len:311 (-) Transcript_26967:142-1074(-)
MTRTNYRRRLRRSPRHHRRRRRRARRCRRSTWSASTCSLPGSHTCWRSRERTRPRTTRSRSSTCTLASARWRRAPRRMRRAVGSSCAPSPTSWSTAPTSRRPTCSRHCSSTSTCMPSSSTSAAPSRRWSRCCRRAGSSSSGYSRRRPAGMTGSCSCCRRAPPNLCPPPSTRQSSPMCRTRRTSTRELRRIAPSHRGKWYPSTRRLTEASGILLPVSAGTYTHRNAPSGWRWKRIGVHAPSCQGAATTMNRRNHCPRPPPSSSTTRFRAKTPLHTPRKKQAAPQLFCAVHMFTAHNTTWPVMQSSECAWTA